MATASLPAGEVEYCWQAAGAASPPAQKKLAAHETHRPSASRAKPGWQVQRPVSVPTDARQPACEQKSSNEDPYFANRLPALAGVWLSGNSSALRLALGYDRETGAQAGVRAENYGSMEFARVPEGLRLLGARRGAL